MIAYYVNNRSKKIAAAFSIGARCAAVRANHGYKGGEAFTYGWMRGQWEVLQEAERAGANWYYADNGYIGGKEYIRVTRNALQYMGVGAPADPARLEHFALKIRPWSRRGRHVLLASQSEAWYKFLGYESRIDWETEVSGEILKHTDRPILVRRKETRHPLYAHLRDAWCVVTHSSNVAVDAAIAGVPCFVTGWGVGRMLGGCDLSQIESPPRPDNRHEVLSLLAANQWTMEEMRAGKCIADLRSV